MFDMFLANVVPGNTMTEVLIGSTAMVFSAVFGAVYASWSGRKNQMLLLEKQIELNKEMHAQLLKEQQEFATRMEQDRRQFEQSQEFHREARNRAQEMAREARQPQKGD
ncbi:MAG: hypothetical protein AB7K09_22230 [Planctomycetota bacterium]